jgi:hypothetical protein
MRISKQTREARDRGAALLDAALPEWRASIDKDTLDMTSGKLCVLGQVLGGYLPGRELLGGPSGENMDMEHVWGIHNGFVARYMASNVDRYADHADALRRAWLEIS